MSNLDGTPLKDGDWLAHCDGCGRKSYFSDLKIDWQGFYMCANDWDEKPWLFKQRNIAAEKISVPVIRKQSLPTNKLDPDYDPIGDFNLPDVSKAGRK